MSPPHVIWFGPVNNAQAHQDGPAVWMTCTGSEHPTCAEKVEALGSDLGRVASQFKIPADDHVVLRGFSNGGSAMKRLLATPENRARIDAVTLSDATYEEKAGAVAPGFLAFALEAAGGGKLFVATASSSPNTWGGGNKPNGSQVLDALRSEIEQQSGQRFAEIAQLPGVELQPVKAWRLGGIYLADYGATLRHEEHATKLAPQVWSGIVEPWISGEHPAPAPGADPGGDVGLGAGPSMPDLDTSQKVGIGGLVALGVVAAAAVGVWAFQKASKKLEGGAPWAASDHDPHAGAGEYGMAWIDGARHARGLPPAPGAALPPRDRRDLRVAWLEGALAQGKRPARDAMEHLQMVPGWDRPGGTQIMSSPPSSALWSSTFRPGTEGYGDAAFDGHEMRFTPGADKPPPEARTRRLPVPLASLATLRSPTMGPVSSSDARTLRQPPPSFSDALATLRAGGSTLRSGPPSSSSALTLGQPIPSSRALTMPISSSGIPTRRA